MLEMDEMSSKEIQKLLQQVGDGQLGCVFEGHPYVVPMHYYLQDSDIYIFTTVGMKTKYMDGNPEVCLQVEEVRDFQHWRSVVVNGRGERLTQQQDIDRAMQLVKENNRTLSRAINRT
jgi:nitroimidazol reductase NimA-like FMN-containing flavoprotein (pyridoxamine 5'-phosphate oxidase superfamily)